MKLKQLLCASILALVLCAAGARAAVVNGNFETGDFTGWTAAGNVEVGTFYGGTSGPNSVSFNSADTPPTGFIEQTLATLAGQAYRLTFDYGVYSIASAGSHDLAVSVLGNTPRLFQVVSDSHSGLPLSFTSFSFDFTADSAASTLRFSDLAVNDTVSIDGVLDNVQIAAIPEPSTYALMFAGLGVVAFAVRRRRKAA